MTGDKMQPNLTKPKREASASSAEPSDRGGFGGGQRHGTGTEAIFRNSKTLRRSNNAFHQRAWRHMLDCGWTL